MSEGELPLGQTTQGVELLKYIYTHGVMTDQWLIRYTTWNQNKISQHVSKSEKTKSCKYWAEFRGMSRDELYRDKKKKVETHCPPCISHENLGCGRKLGNVVHCFTMVG